MPAMQEKPSARCPACKAAKNEPAGDGARRGRAPGYGDLAKRGGRMRRSAMRLVASDDVTGGQ